MIDIELPKYVSLLQHTIGQIFHKKHYQHFFTAKSVLFIFLHHLQFTIPQTSHTHTSNT